MQGFNYFVLGTQLNSLEESRKRAWETDPKIKLERLMGNRQWYSKMPTWGQWRIGKYKKVSDSRFYFNERAFVLIKNRKTWQHKAWTKYYGGVFRKVNDAGIEGLGPKSGWDGHGFAANWATFVNAPGFGRAISSDAEYFLNNILGRYHPDIWKSIEFDYQVMFGQFLYSMEDAFDQIESLREEKVPFTDDMLREAFVPYNILHGLQDGIRGRGSKTSEAFAKTMEVYAINYGAHLKIELEKTLGKDKVAEMLKRIGKTSFYPNEL